MSRARCGLVALLLWAGAGHAAADLTLGQALDEALASHRDAARARLSLREARLAHQEVQLRLLPRLDLSATLPGILDTRTDVWTGAGDSLRLSRVAWQQRRDSGGLALAGELPLGTTLEAGWDVWHRSSKTGSFDEGFGRTLRLGVRQDLLPRTLLWGDLREAGREAQVAGLEALEQLAAFRHQVAGGFLDLLRAQQALDLARLDLQAGHANRERARSRFEAGYIAESDFLKVELEDLQIQAAFQADSLELTRQERTFLRRLGRDPGSPAPRLDSRLGPEQGAPADPGALAADSLLKAVEEGHAGLSRSRLELWRARRALRAAGLDRLPEVDLALDWAWNEEGEQWPDGLEDPVLDRSLRLDLAWPLFAQGGKGRARQRAGLALRRARLDHEALREELAGELERLVLRLDEQRMRAPLVERQVQLAEQDARISQERFQAGQITSQLLIDAERALSQARLRRLDLDVERVRARLELQRLCGGDREAVRQALGKDPDDDR